MSPLKFGILGAAKIAYKYTAQAMIDSNSAQLVGVAARDPRRADEFARVFACEVFDTYEEIVTSDRIDAVYIPLPIALHAEWALRAVQAGKHVLCEKSLAADYVSAKTLIDEARARSLVVAENFMCERHPQNEFAQNLVGAGGLGTIQHLSLSFGFPPFAPDDLKYSHAMAGGALNDAGAYCVDMASYYIKSKPERVSAVLGNHGYDVDITGAATLTYGNELSAQLSFGFDHDYRNEARIWGSSGQLSIDRSFSIPPTRIPSVTITRNTVSESVDLPAANHFISTLNHFAALTERVDKTRVLDKIEMQAIVMQGTRDAATDGRIVDFESEYEAWKTLRPWN